MKHKKWRDHPEHNALAPWRKKLHTIIFEADTPGGKAFDVVLIVAIIMSVVVVMLDSVDIVRVETGKLMLWLEWGFTLLFTVEYGLRLLSLGNPMRYARSFFGVVDLLSILPTYLSLLVTGAETLLILRILRLLRIFRVFKLSQYLAQADILATALKASRYKITVFLISVLSLAVIMGALMYLVEGRASGFTSIPRGMYWAIVTMTTVGYGDITPHTVLGQMLSSLLMIMGYGIIAVPTGIVSVELAQTQRMMMVSTQACQQCAAEGHDIDAKHCKYCGAEL